MQPNPTPPDPNAAPGACLPAGADGRTRIPIDIDIALQPGPDGKPWVKLTVSVGLSSHSWVMPEATSDELAPVLADAMRQGAAGARRAALGLILPTAGGDGAMQLPVNGARPT